MFLGFLKNADYSNPSVWLKQGKQTQFIFSNKELINLKEELKEINVDKDLFKIIAYMNFKKKYSSQGNFNKFSRTAKEIFASGIYMGCSDYALVFETITRQLGIPTVHVQLADLDWIEDLNNGKNEGVRGHHVCECFIGNKWVCVDVSANKINGVYDKNNFNIGNRICFAKSLDIFETGIYSLKENNDIMKKLFLKTN